MAKPYYHPPVKRSITIAGHATSISLEPVFWDLLKSKALQYDIPVNALVAQVDLERMQSDTPPGLASAIRVWLLAKQTDNSDLALAFNWVDQISDYDALGALMYEAVHAEPSPYTAAQRAAWMPKPRSGQDWHLRLARQKVLMACDHDGRAIGFMSLEPTNTPESAYVDFAYIAAAYRGRGLFRQLYDRIEVAALADGATQLSTHASLMARPAFAKMGFVISAQEDVEMGQELLRRFAMDKWL